MTYPFKSLRLSHSSRQLLHSCARKFEFRKVYEQGGQEQTIPTDAGHALHAGYQHWFVHRDIDAAVAVFMQRYPWHLNDNPNFNRSAEACYYTLERMISSGLYQEYVIAMVKNQHGEVVPAVEVPFEIEIKGFRMSEDHDVKITYVGFIDLIMYNNFTSMFAVSDIKTHRDNSKDLVPKFRFDEQCLPYGMVLERVLDSPMEDYEVHYMSCFIDIEKPEIRDFSFMKSKKAVRDWARGLYVDLVNIKTFADTMWWPRHGGSCISFFKPCQFYELCHERNHEALKAMIKPTEFDAMKDKEPWLKLELELAA